MEISGQQKETYLVTSASGTQGCAFIEQFENMCQSKNFSNIRLKGMVLHSEGEGAQKIEQCEQKRSGQGLVDLVQCDLNNIDSVKQHMKDCSGLVLILSPPGLGNGDWNLGVKREIDVGKRLIDLAIQFGIKNIVYSSSIMADIQTGVGHIDSKGVIEKYLLQNKDKFQHWFILRPAHFFHNLEMLNAKEIKEQGVLRYPFDRQYRLAGVAEEDIGKALSRAVLERDTFTNDFLELASDELPMEEWARALNCQYQQCSLDDIKLPAFREMYAYMKDHRHIINLKRCMSIVPELTSLGAWAKKHNLTYQKKPSAP